ncbi:hypothetical protein GCM10010306_005140 [Streptomyces umbrinus]|nr:hypothetical protein GCM10010306_005140 [Streptomyces umbrinus]
MAQLAAPSAQLLRVGDQALAPSNVAETRDRMATTALTPPPSLFGQLLGTAAPAVTPPAYSATMDTFLNAFRKVHGDGERGGDARCATGPRPPLWAGCSL